MTPMDELKDSIAMNAYETASAPSNDSGSIEAVVVPGDIVDALGHYGRWTPRVGMGFKNAVAPYISWFFPVFSLRNSIQIPR